LEQNTRNEEFVQFEYNAGTLRFLRSKLDEFTINVFRMVVKENQNNNGLKGLVKGRIDNYLNLRKRYDASFLTLEAQGFIEKQEDGNMTPYFVTIRGRQLATLLSDEKKIREEQ
jgi:RNase P/RNase MRP subunit p29